jgi:cysteine-rich repeat protein
MRVATLCVLIALVAPAWSAEVVPVGPEFRVSRIGDTYHSYSDGRARDPRAVRMSDDGFVVVWEAYSYKYGYYYSQSGYGVFARRFDADGKPKAKEVPVFFHEGYEHRFLPNVAIDSTDRFVVVWSDYDYPTQFGKVHARRYNAAGNPQGASFVVNPTVSALAYIQTHIGVARTAGDGFVVTWTGLPPGPSPSIHARRFDASANPVTAEFQVNTTPLSSCCLGYPDVASDASGRFMVVWQDDAVGHQGVFGQAFDAAGSTVGSEFQSLSGPVDEGPVRIAASAAGDFLPVGYVNNVATARVHGADGTPVGPQFAFPQTPPYLNPDYGAAAADPDGNFVVAWQDYNAYAIHGQRYTSAGAPDGSPFEVALPTYDLNIGNPGLSTPSIAVDKKGDFVVVWANTYFIFPESEPEGPYNAPGIWGRMFAVCGNGRIGRTQTCDDGNATSLDGCSERCDREACFSCTGEPSTCAAVPACTAVCINGAPIEDTAIMTFTGIAAPVGRQGVAFKGKIPNPPVAAGAYNPATEGMEAIFTTQDLVYGRFTPLPIPPGLTGSGCHPRDGWKLKGLTAFTYKNVSGALPPACTPGSANGLRTVKVRDNIATGGGISFEVRVKKATLGAIPAPPLMATIVLGQSPGAGSAGRCARIIFSRSIGTRFYP